MAEYLSSREDSVQLLKEVANIAEVIGEHVNLKRAGTNLKGLCPFHSEKTPSFTVNPDRRSYHCFGCGEGGDVFSFMMNYHRITFPEALKELAGKYNIVLDESSLSPHEREKAQLREKLFQVNDHAAEIYHELLLNSPQADKARLYLNERGIPGQTIRDFKLGYAPDSWDFFCRACGSRQIPLTDALEAGLLVARSKGGHYDRFRDRILFPISNLTGKTVGFGGRILGDGQPKYLNSPESLVFDKGGILFGLYQNKESIRKERSCILVEGNFDLLSLVVHGVNNLAAPLGTALTLAHIRSLKGYADKVILLFDGDQAGFKAALRAVPLFLTEQLPAEIVILPDNHDPDSFIRKHGKGKLTELIKRARSLPEFVFEALVAQHGLTLEGKSKIIQDLRPIISLIDDKNLQRTLFVSHFSKKLDLAPQQLQEGIPARVPPAVKTAEKQECRRKVNPLLPMKQRQLLEFLIIYPEHIQDFCNAGLEDFIVEPFAREILDLLAANAGTGYHSGNPEKLLEIAQGDTRSFISRVLISTPVFTEEIKAEIATEWITWLKKSQMKLKKNSLVHLIGKAHQNNNEQLCMDLMEQKKQLDEGLVS